MPFLANTYEKIMLACLWTEEESHSKVDMYSARYAQMRMMVIMKQALFSYTDAKVLIYLIGLN